MSVCRNWHNTFGKDGVKNMSQKFKSDINGQKGLEHMNNEYTK